jgi:hypothetical protein
MRFVRWTAALLVAGMSLSIAGCGGGGSSTPPPPVTYVLTVNSTNPASGVAITVGTPDNNSLGNGTTSFTRTYNTGMSVTLTAPSTSGSDPFVSWSGCTSASGVTCNVTLGANTTVTANYSVPPPTYVLTVDSTNPASGVAIAVSPADNNSAGNGTTSFTRTYNSGTTVTLTAPSTSGTNTFSSWTGCTSTSGVTCTVTLNSATTVTANYTVVAPPPVTYVLTVNSTNPASGVAIVVAPADNNSATNGTTSFTRTYNSGTSVTLTAPMLSGTNTFTSWSGCTAASTNVCTVSLAANTTVTANYATPVATTYVLTVNSTAPSSGVAITVSPADNNSATNGSTSFTRTYNSGTKVTLSAPSTAGGNSFDNWTGCTSAITTTCSVTMTANTMVTANYNGPSVTSVTVTPDPATVTIGATQQFTATVNGTGLSGNTVTWTLAGPTGSTLSPGTLTSSGLYTTPYPAPATVTVTATSTQDTSKSASVTVTLAAPATAAGPALTVDAGTQTHAISPYIYGMNAYLLDSATAANTNIAVARWGGDDTSRYNYKTGVTNSANDYYFENFTGASGMLGGGSFTGFITTSSGVGVAALGTVPVLGYVSNSTVLACSFPESTYPGQVSYNGACGNGVYQDGMGGCTTAGGCSIYGNANTPALTSIAAPPPTAPGVAGDTPTWAEGSWTGGWVNSVVGTYGPGNPTTGTGKGVAIWDLDNEPSEWDAVHRDVHPLPFTYDELTNGGIGSALAIKTVDPTALVSGPIMDSWDDYFYSKKDVESGWSSGPCYEFWDNPVDRKAHGGVPFIEYYLQQMAQASSTYSKRLLDYVDVHTYFSATYNGQSVGLTTAGDTGEQQARLNSTRVFWDPTYTDPNFTQPNYTTDTNYTTSCTTPLQAPQVIPMMQGWVAKDYPGTKVAIDEYNWGGNEAINGAVAQADILGIFGKYGLDLGSLWPTTNYVDQGPGNMAFEIYRNYDGNKSTFGDKAVTSTSANQGTLSVYGAVRSSDGAVTIVVINKTYGALTSTVAVENYPETTAGTAASFLYSNANLNAIVAQAGVTITPPASGSTTSTITATFPAQSITLLVVPVI